MPCPHYRNCIVLKKVILRLLEDGISKYAIFKRHEQEIVATYDFLIANIYVGCSLFHRYSGHMTNKTCAYAWYRRNLWSELRTETRTIVCMPNIILFSTQHANI